VFGVVLTPEHDPASIDLWASLLAGFPGHVPYCCCGPIPDWWAGFKVWRDATLLPAGANVVHVVPTGEESILQFSHPEDACYVFGPDHESMVHHHAGPTVFIPSDGAHLYSHHAGAIVLYDRLLKSS